jgi:beta-apo-4'-carotenal oxygenase
VSEINFCQSEIAFICKNLAEWAKTEDAVDIDEASKLMRPRIRKEPLGVVLVIAYE